MTEMAGFETDRMRVVPCSGLDRATVIGALGEILTPDVLLHLPDPLQLGEGDGATAVWLDARLAESDVYCIQKREGDAVIGVLILASFEEEAGMVTHIGYLFGKTAWGHGYASEMMRGLVLWRRALNTGEQLLGGVEAGNPASARVLEKAGFTPVAEMSDAETTMFGLAL
ncbi:MAG: GNAT family N-acetyltransferase [Boseongicola sp.]|nr:MAG: GNAT family N-acetyltransferase [Boseongicola sp.]